MNRLIRGVLLIALLASYSACAQSWEQLTSKVVEYYQKGDYSIAIGFAQKAVDRAKIEFGLNHPGYATSLNNLALLYRSVGQNDQAIPLLQKSLQITEKVLGKAHPDYATSLNNLAGVYRSMGQYEQALPLYQQASKILEQGLGKRHSSYVTSLNNLALLYENMGRYEQALTLFQQVLQLTEQISGKNHPSYATILNNIALLYQDMGQYEQALSLYQQVLVLREQVLGKTHPEYAQSLTSLAQVYSSIGQYEEAVQLLQKALLLTEQVLGKTHPDYATHLNNLAGIYRNMGQYQQALSLYQQASEIYEKALGKTHPDYATSLNNLALLYQKVGQYEKALSLFQQASKILEQVLGKQHPSYATSLNNLALLYENMGRYGQALPIFQQVLALRGQVLGKRHSNYAQSLNNLALSYQSIGQYEQAISLLQQALQLTEQSLGKTHPEYANSLNNLALSYQSAGQYEQALPLFQQAQLALVNDFRKQTLWLSEQQAQAYQQTLLYNFDIYNSFTLQYQSQLPTLQTWPFDNALFWKGQLLEQNTALRRNIQQANDSTLTALFAQWQHNRQQLAQQQRPDSTLQTRVETLEQQLAQRSASFRKATQDSLITYKQVQKHLKPGEVAIEFTHFSFRNDNRWTDSTYYCASVLRATDSIPTLVYLCEARQLDTLLRSASTNAAAIQNFYPSRGAKVKSLHQAAAQQLYQLIWKPLEPLLKEGQTIYYAPSGLLHKVAMAALPVAPKKLLMDQYQLHQVSSTRVLTETPPNTHPQSGWQAALYGGVSYQADSLDLAQAVKSVSRGANTMEPSNKRSQGRSYSLTPLPATAQEVERIQGLMQTAQIKSQVFIGATANEESFKALPQPRSPEILHLATHGFFFPDPVQQKRDNVFLVRQSNRFEYAENPLLRSGLVLAGANRVWQGQVPLAGLEDGILTAYEVAQLDLSNTKLVVLSACETALGDIKGSEGVFGLQRAFKAAGVPYLLMSLWQVPDKETAEIMQLFYSNYLSGVPIEEAFRQAQLEMRKKYEPYYWAAFVLVR